MSAKPFMKYSVHPTVDRKFRLNTVRVALWPSEHSLCLVLTPYPRDVTPTCSVHPRDVCASAFGFGCDSAMEGALLFLRKLSVANGERSEGVRGTVTSFHFVVHTRSQWQGWLFSGSAREQSERSKPSGNQCSAWSACSASYTSRAWVASVTVKCAAYRPAEIDSSYHFFKHRSC